MPRSTSDYLGLITSWHSNKPRFMATITALVQPLADAQAMLAAMVADFSLETAVGVQLDIVGQWVGRTRHITTPITGVYFSFDQPAAARVGWNQGHWFGPYSPTEGIKSLDDETYRKVLQLQAVANEWDGTLPSIAAQLDILFPGIVVQDMGDTPTGLMTMDVLIPGEQMSSLLLSILEQDFPIHPSGVLVNMIESSVTTEPIFAFDIDLVTNGPLGGWDQAAWGLVVFSE